MSYCGCDYEPATVFNSRMVKARKFHTCVECSVMIKPGDQYEYSFGVWDGIASSQHICARCTQLKQYVQDHVPCFGWIYGELHNCALECLAEYEKELPGLTFGAKRLLVNIRKVGGALHLVSA